MDQEREGGRHRLHQLPLFGGAHDEDRCPEPEEPEAAEPTKKQSRKKGGRKEIPDDLPREEVVIDFPEGERSCELCDAEMTPFKDIVSERVHVVPATVVVIKTIRKQYRCPDGHHLVSAPLLSMAIPKRGILAIFRALDRTIRTDT